MNLIHAFKPGVTCTPCGNDLVLGDGTLAGLRWRNPSAGWRRVIEQLGGAGGTPETLAALLTEADGTADWAVLHYRLLTLSDKGFLCWTLTADSVPLVTLHPMTARFRFNPAVCDRAAHYKLSRFAALRTEAGRWVLETPLSPAKLLIRDGRVLAVLGRLAEPASLAGLNAAAPELGDVATAGLLALLVTMQAAAPCTDEGGLPEDTDLALRQWEPLDLMFHSRSRLGRHDYGFGGTYRFLDQIDPLPAVKPVPEGAALIALPTPDLDQLQRDDPPFAAVIEKRRSVRDYDGRRLTVDQLGEFFYRAARVKEQYGIDRERGILYPVSRRPYPGGGAMYELELYLTIADCDGLAPGLYHYDPERHSLRPVAEFAESMRQLLREAQLSSGAAAPPPALITLAARFQRFAWKYQSMAYATILKNVGVLYHQLYLTAAVMGLAPCGLGGGNSDLFAALAGLEYYRETSVGEFMLGGCVSDPSV